MINMHNKLICVLLHCFKLNVYPPRMQLQRQPKTSLIKPSFKLIKLISFYYKLVDIYERECDRRYSYLKLLQST